MSEKKLNKDLIKFFKKENILYERIENSVGVGTPDFAFFSKNGIFIVNSNIFFIVYSNIIFIVHSNITFIVHSNSDNEDTLDKFKAASILDFKNIAFELETVSCIFGNIELNTTNYMLINTSL